MAEQSTLFVRGRARARENNWFCVALVFIVAAMLVPTVLPRVILGEDYKGALVAFTDASMYQSHVTHVGRGHFSDGNPYLLEHADQPALVIFLGDYLHALPMLAGLSVIHTLQLNLLIFTVLFAFAFYHLFLVLGVSRRLSALGVFLLYLLFFSHIDRPSNMQPFLPLLAIFYIGLVGLIRTPSKRSIVLVAGSLGVMFYFYSYLWQSFLITLALTAVISFFLRRRDTLVATVKATIIGCVIGAPSLLYIFWLSHSSPYFWESLGRYGLVNTRLPMMEALYSGGWVGLTLLFLGIFLYRERDLVQNEPYRGLSIFFVTTGLGLWIMQVSNIFTGKLLENAQHMIYFIAGWLILFVFAFGEKLYAYRLMMGRGVKVFVLIGIGVLTYVSFHNVYRYYVLNYIIDPQTTRLTDIWRAQQASLGPLSYIDAHESNPVVIWEDPGDMVTWDTPVFSKNYVLFATPGMWHLVPDGEIIERYLVAEYFSNPTEDDLKKSIDVYLGRQWTFHRAKTIERGIKLCKIVHYLSNASYDCGVVPTSVDVIGEERFKKWEQKFTTDIKPNIREYLVKYHVSYILKDLQLHPEYHPEKLGAVKVYEDTRYELWKLP